jgi:hypothetical protein
LRSLIYCLFYIIGYDFWVFPYFLVDGVGLWKSLQVPLSIEKRNDDLLSILFRVLFFLAVVALGYFLYSFPDYPFEFYQALIHYYNEILDWGNSKITNYHVRPFYLPLE